MLTKKSKYGLKAMAALVAAAGQGPMPISALAAQERIPRKFLEAILLELQRRGLLRSKKGRGGGYYLGRKPSEISMGQVIRILEGPLALVPCVSQTAYRPCDECVDEETCEIRRAMKKVRHETARILDHTMFPNTARMRVSARRPAAIRRPGKKTSPI